MYSVYPSTIITEKKCLRNFLDRNDDKRSTNNKDKAGRKGKGGKFETAHMQSSTGSKRLSIYAAWFEHKYNCIALAILYKMNCFALTMEPTYLYTPT